MIFKVKLANTPSSQEQGLMYVRDLPADSGMLFDFNSKKVLNFWGRNTFIPLDIAFIDNDIVVKISHIVPFSDRFVSSDVPCSKALEVNAGELGKNDIKVGWKINIETATESQKSKDLKIYFSPPESNKKG